MYKVKFPKDKDFTGNRYGVTFLNGLAETENSFVATHLKAKGFEVSEDKKADKTAEKDTKDKKADKTAE